MSLVVPGSTLQVSQLDGNTLSIVGFAVSLSQSEVPYTIVPNAPVAASSTDLLVYGDTVTITGDLVNPGRAIAIYARQIVVGATAFLSVSGADAVTSYVAGSPVAQADTTDGGAGTEGAGGSTGRGAGTIILAAESIQSSGPDTGAGTPGRALCLGQLQSPLTSLMPSVLPAYQSVVGQATISLPTQNFANNLTITDATVGDVQHPTSVTVLPLDPQTGALTVELTFDTLTLQGTVSMTADGQSVQGPLTATSTLTVTVAVIPVPAPGSTAPAPTVAIANVASTASTSMTLVNEVIEAELNSTLGGSLEASLLGTLQPAAEALAAAAANALLASQEGLILAAIGGTGGRGQDGHAGNSGGTGPAGQNTDIMVPLLSPPPPQSVGGPGNTGGQGGDAGTSGAGGLGGTITMNVVDPPTIAVAAFANGGMGGVAAAAGAGGAGGSGGHGGTYYVGPLQSGPAQQVTAPDGPTGSQGPAATFQGAAGALGTAGSAQQNGAAFGQSASFSYTQLAPSLALYQLLFAQQGAKLAYLNAQSAADYQNVIVLYQWLQNVTQPFTGTSTPAGVSGQDAATRAAMYQAVTLELARLNASLDYYGNPLNWVPVLTWSALDTFVGQLISLGENIDTQFQNVSEPSAQASAAQQASQLLQDSLWNIKAYENTINIQIAALDEQITALDRQVDAAIANVQQEMTALEQQYTTEQTGANCTFADVLNALSSIVQLSTSAFNPVNDLTKALGIETAIANLIQGADNLVVQSTASDSTYSALSAAWSSLASTLNQYGSNSALIVVEDEQFDSLLQQYFSGLQATPEVESDVNGLINLIQTRNQLLLNYTAQFAQLQRLQTQYAQKSAELENVAALLASNQTPQLPDYLAFLQGSLTEIGNAIVDNLYQANQAFQYWSVQTQTLQVTSLDIASLSTASAQLLDNVEDYLTGNTGRPFSPFNTMSFIVTATAQPNAFAQLQATGVLVVQLAVDDPGNPFEGYYNVTVDTVSVSLPGITPPAGTASDPTVLQLTLVQLGPDVLVAQDGTTMTFTHPPRPVPYEFNYTTNDNTVVGAVGDANQGFTGLSPFATWSIDFTANGNPNANAWLTLSEITAVELTFTGQLLGQISAGKRSRG
jgi:hypothetical protein